MTACCRYAISCKNPLVGAAHIIFVFCWLSFLTNIVLRFLIKLMSIMWAWAYDAYVYVICIHSYQICCRHFDWLCCVSLPYAILFVSNVFAPARHWWNETTNWLPTLEIWVSFTAIKKYYHRKLVYIRQQGRQRTTSVNTNEYTNHNQYPFNSMREIKK